MQSSGSSRKIKYSGMQESYTYVDGNTVRKIDPMEHYRQKEYQKQLEQERKRQLAEKRRKEARAAKRRAAARRNAVKSITLVASMCILSGLIVTVLNDSIKNNELSTQISALESEYNTISNQNDAKEYDINTSVDINDVIKTATEEYGMVKSSTSQVMTYNGEEKEYIQQLAKIPY